ncbi:unnamed protein product [Adineta ricciae]|uniref:Uncharacterized protein n=1 Tax=Adineta ricciae TaxID=249248 RepID=A0A814DLJ4_ADIRI|nr:unnamed protein product [Adineta ricciae]CAF0955735.1 unnamed protein product [Adineta ricciae]
MLLLKFVHHPLKTFVHPRLFICRHQSQKLVDLINKKTPVELETNDELENHPCENTIEWNKKLKAYRMRGEGNKALKFFEIGLRKYAFQPDYITYISMLELCKEIKDLDNGRFIHRRIWNSSVRENSRIQTLLMELYMKCGDMDSAREMFDSLKHRTVVEYNTLMTAYNNNQLPDQVIHLFHTMSEKDKVKPNSTSYMIYIQACIKLKAFDKGKAIHEELMEKSSVYTKNKELMNQIVTLYTAAGDYSTAEEYFRKIKEPTVPNYVALMNYYNQSEKYEETWKLYEQMKAQRKIQPDVPTYLAVLSAVKQLKDSAKAKQIQEDITKQNLWQNHAEIEKLFAEIVKTSNE